MEEKKMPVSQEKIYKIMLFMTFGVSAIFLLKNIIAKSVQGGSCNWNLSAYFQCFAFCNEKSEGKPVKTADDYQYMSSVCSIFYFP